MKQLNDEIRKLKRTKKKSSQNCDSSCYSCPVFRWSVMDIYIARCVVYHVMHVCWIPTTSSNAIFVLKWLCVTQIWENDYAAPTITWTLHIQSRSISLPIFFFSIEIHAHKHIHTFEHRLEIGQIGRNKKWRRKKSNWRDLVK